MINQLSKTELKEYNEIKELLLFTPIEIERSNNYTANATLSGGGFEEISGQLGLNSLLEVAKARKEVYLKQQNKKLTITEIKEFKNSFELTYIIEDNEEKTIYLYDLDKNYKTDIKTLLEKSFILSEKTKQQIQELKFNIEEVVYS